MKLLFIWFLFIVNLFAFSDDPIISKMEVSKDNKTYIDISTIKDENYFDKFYLKLFLNKDIIQNKKYFLRILHNYKNIKDINIEAFRNDNELIIEIDKLTQNEIVIEIDTSDSKAGPYLNLEIFDEEGFKNILDTEKLYFGLAYGIVFCAFLYNFVLFLYNREKSFLYYSLLQLSLLLFMITNIMTLDFFKPLYEYIHVSDFLGQLSFIFAVLFNREFLDSKNTIPKVDKLLVVLLFLVIIDTIVYVIIGNSILFDYLPISIFVGILLLSSFLVYKQGYKIALFYILGWSVIFLCLIVVEYDFFMVSDIYALYIGFPLESLILSFSLGYKMKELEKKKTMHEQMLIHQNKLASMGQMLNNIAHQYRQPLTHLGYIMMNINSAFEHGELDKKYLDKKIKQANNQLLFMSNTIDSFRDFYKPKKQKELFYIKTAISNAVFIIKPIIEEYNIKLEVKVDKDIQILGFENEYSQVVLNLLSNAKDELVKNSIENAKIEINFEKGKLFIKDNANGVPKELEEKIFEPYFTTKEKSSGIGLYMSMLIIQEHFNGELLLQNSKEGATFIIKV